MTAAGSVCAWAPRPLAASVTELARVALLALGGDCDARSRPKRRHSASEASAEPSHPQFHRAPWSDSYLKILEELFGSPNAGPFRSALMAPALFIELYTHTCPWPRGVIPVARVTAHARAFRQRYSRRRGRHLKVARGGVRKPSRCPCKDRRSWRLRLPQPFHRELVLGRAIGINCMG
jgi:hypothetical protein